MDRRAFVIGMGAGGLLTTVTLANAITRDGASPANRSTSQNVLDHGGVGNGLTLDDEAFQAAVDALPASGGEVYIPAGTFLRSGPTITRGKAVVFRGAGHSVSYLKVLHAANDIFVHSGVESAEFRDFTIFNTLPRSGGAYIRFDPGEGRINYSSAVERVRMYGHYIGIDLVRCSDARLRDCIFVGNLASRTAILLRNLTNADSGDNSITGSFFSGPAGVGIRQESSGGLRLMDNKFNGLTDSFTLSPQADRGTSILLIQGNSFENASRQNIALEQGNGRSIFTYGLITGNEFGYAPVAISVKANGATFYDFLIDHNVFAVPKGGAGLRLDGGNTFQVKDNLFDGIAGVGTAVIQTQAEQNLNLGDNTVRNITARRMLS